MYRDEAVEVLLESLQCEDSPQMQALSSFILANLGGTYSWEGEAYTMPWLVKKTGLILPQHRNLIKTYDFLDQSLQVKHKLLPKFSRNPRTLFQNIIKIGSFTLAGYWDRLMVQQNRATDSPARDTCVRIIGQGDEEQDKKSFKR